MSAGTRVRIEQHDGYLVLSHAQETSRWESHGRRLLLTAPEGTPPLTTETVRELIERGRR